MDKFDWVLFRRLFAVFSIIGVGLWVILFIGTWQSEEWTSFNLWVSLTAALHNIGSTGITAAVLAAVVVIVKRR